MAVFRCFGWPFSIVLPGRFHVFRALSPKTIKNLKKALRDADHPLTVKLKEIGVSLVSSGYGKGSKSYLLKA